MQQPKVALAVVSPDAQLCARVRNLAMEPERGIDIRAEITTPLAQLDRDVVERLRASDAPVVLLDLGRDPTLGLRLARYLAEANPARTFVLTGPAATPEVLLEAMRVGASEYVPVPFDDAALGAALGRAIRRSGSAPTQQVHEAGRVVAVFSAKGGTGVSTTAANLAVQLHLSTQRSAMLLDLDLELGSAALYLALHPRYSVLDVARNLHRMDQNLLGSFVERHQSGVHVLASPAQPNSSETLTKEQVRSLLQLLQRQYDYVVIDLARSLTPAAVGTFEAAESILLIATPDLPTLRNTKKVLPLIERTLGSMDKVRLVLNRYDPTDIITSEDVSRVLGREVYWSLQNDQEQVAASLNEGEPVVFRSKSRFARDLRELAEDLVGPPTPNGRRRRGVGGLFRRRAARGKES